MKYLNSMVTFREVPDEIALCLSITNCHIHCKDCNQPELWSDNGTVLTYEKLTDLINTNSGISCLCLLGGTPEEATACFEFTKSKFPKLQTAWYTGLTLEEVKPLDAKFFDYIKVGPWLGITLDNSNTNQKLFKIEHKDRIHEFKDITYKFWK